jgi:hypothetical protein
MKIDLDGRSTALVTGNGGLVNREVLFIFSNRKTGLLGYHWIDYRWSFNPNSMSLNSKYNRRPVKHIHDLLLLFFLIIMSNLVFFFFFFSFPHGRSIFIPFYTSIEISNFICTQSMLRLKCQYYELKKISLSIIF